MIFRQLYDIIFTRKMKSSGNFFISKILLVFLASNIQISVATIPLVKDISLITIDYGVRFAPAPAQDLLKCILKATVYGVDKYFNSEGEKNDTESLLDQVSGKVDVLHLFVKQQCDGIEEQLSDLQLGRSYKIMDDVLKLLTKFNNYYHNDFVNCIIGKHCTEKTRQDVIFDWLRPHSLQRQQLDDFHNIYIIKTSNYVNEDRIFDAIRKITDKSKALRRSSWTRAESVQNTIFNFYNSITGSISRMYHVILHCMIETYVDERGREKEAGSMYEIDSLIIKFKKTMKEISFAARKALAQSPRDIYPDDPPIYKKNENYDRLTRFIAAYLIESSYIKEREHNSMDYGHDQKEFNINPNEIVGLPDKIKTWKRYNLERQCEFIICKPRFSEVRKIWIDHNDTERIYDHFEATDKESDKQIFGKEGRNTGSLTLYDVKKKPFHLCKLDYTTPDIYSVRSFSNKKVMASPGKVVTGIRWIIRNGIVCMDIQEGTLVRGTVNPNTVHWKITQEDITNVILLSSHKDIFNLDDIILPKNYFLTGVQFFTHESSLALKAFGSKVDNEGSLDGSKPVSFSSDPDENKRQEIKLDDVDVPEDAPHNHQHEIRGIPGKHYVKFQPSGIKEDAGQTTIPYLDIQPVITKPPSPLGGAGTYYKGMNGFGGFVGLKLISPDIVTIVDEENIETSFKEVEKKMTLKKSQSQMKKSP